MTSRFGGFIIIKTDVISLDPSPAAVESLDAQPVNIEHFEKTIEYLRPIEENERQYEGTELPIM